MRRPAALFPIAPALAATILVPGAQADPTAITACQTISQSGSYVLANNMENRVDMCLKITTNEVTIDLAGFRVVGRGFGIFAVSDLQGITVRNGSVVGARGLAIDLHNAVGSIVEGVHASNMEAGGGIFAYGIIRGNTVVNPGPGNGITASGIVTDNYVSGTPSGVGISASGTVRSNTAVDNEVGIEVFAGSTVIGNTATGNTKVGIQADCPSNLTDNTAVNNGTNLVLNGQGCHNEDNVAP